MPIPARLQGLVGRARAHLLDPLHRNGYVLMANTVVGSALGFVGWAVAARLLAPEEFGVAAAILSAMLLLALLARLGLDLVLIREYRRIRAGDRRLLRVGVGVPTLLAALASAALVLAPLPLEVASALRASPWLGAAFVATATLWVAGLQIDSVFLGARRPELAVAKNAVVGILRVPAILVLLGLGGVLAVVAGWAVAVAAAFLLSAFVFLPKVLRPDPEAPPAPRPPAGRIWGFSLGAYASGLLQTGLGLLLPLLITERVGAAEAGYYYVAWMIAGLLLIIPSGVGQSLYAELSNGTPARAASRRALAHAYRLLVPAAILLAATGFWLLALFGPDFSARAYVLLALLCAGTVVGALATLGASILAHQGRVLRMNGVSLVAAATTVAGSWIFLPAHGLLAVGASYLVGQALASLVALAALRGPDAAPAPAPHAMGGEAD